LAFAILSALGLESSLKFVSVVRLHPLANGLVTLRLLSCHCEERDSSFYSEQAPQSSLILHFNFFVYS